LIIRNSTSKVLVLNALHKPPLRLLPGFNTVPSDTSDEYFKTEVNKAYLREYLSIMKASDLTADQKAEADLAKTKNDKLNRGRNLNEPAVTPIKRRGA
jgi:hypothetical protein